MSYYPKKPIRSFQDLQVYQLSYNLMVKIIKMEGCDPSVNLKKTVLAIPRLIVIAHSYRFGDSQKAIETLEKAMLNCNLAVHYLELARDLPGSDLPQGPTLNELDFSSFIKQYLQIRGKIMRLQMSWKKFTQEYANK